MTETFRVELRSLLKSHFSSWDCAYVPNTYFLTVEADCEMSAVEVAKNTIFAQLAEKGEWDEFTAVEVINVRLEEEEREKARKEKEEKERKTKEKKLAREIAKAEAEGMTLEEWRKNKATKALCTRLENEIAVLEKELARKKKVLEEKRKMIK